MKKLFIIPYRDRFSHGQVFINHMSKILEDDEYEFIFVHQCDRRPFNRGAMKNVGFLREPLASRIYGVGGLKTMQYKKNGSRLVEK
jgi:hypothetical protein